MQLMPGLVGLSIVDSFVTGVPLFTTIGALHSPEIAYLRNGFNGVATENNVTAYSDAVVHYLRNPDSLALLQKGCDESASRYTLKNMVSNFVDGIVKCVSD